MGVAFSYEERSKLEMTFDDFVEVYTRDMKLKLKENTWITKEAVINSKILSYFKDKKVKDIKPTDIIQW
ncbi:hypothetical protein bsdtb5_39030 [Anaeromicropila herbilytica]|uniref:Integrase SAM-like N-terminal domain-containing protein n=1 Tax=Anaeromicropila herbilytica TaxID=2785025 RepID=A0A7R7EPH2_9FIRM|nr:hypothetical protein bsdtb5_39030 [Anaeromicropila herbilytica]